MAYGLLFGQIFFYKNVLQIHFKADQEIIKVENAIKNGDLILPVFD